MNKRMWIFTAFMVVATLFSFPAFAKDRDNNPPGPKGGPGTNWENPPGPRGGQGMGADKFDFDKWAENHPDLKGKMDLDGDGTLDDSERQSAREKMREHWREKKDEWIEKRKDLREKMDTNNDGNIEPAEHKAAMETWKAEHPYRRDRDNNPPGPKGGPGTNWENPLGPRGGPGMGPDRFDRDNNPPGPRGGAGASPNRKKHR